MRETRKKRFKSPEVLTFKVDVFVMNIPCTNTTGLLEGSWWDGAWRRWGGWGHLLMTKSTEIHMNLKGRTRYMGSNPSEGWVEWRLHGGTCFSQPCGLGQVAQFNFLQDGHHLFHRVDINK